MLRNKTGHGKGFPTGKTLDGEELLNRHQGPHGQGSEGCLSPMACNYHPSHPQPSADG